MAGTSSAKTRFCPAMTNALGVLVFPLLLIRLQMRAGGAQFWHRHLRGVAACDQVADHMIGFDGCARFDVAEHGCRHLRALRSEHAAGPLKERATGVMALGRRDGAAFIEHAEDKILAAR